MGWFDERFTENAERHRAACDVCGRSMWFPASKLGKYRTCGGECAEKARQAVKDARARPCETCGKVFTPRARQVALGQGRFCSKACNNSHQAMNTPEAQRRAREAWRARWNESPFTLRGPANPNWNGGKEASRARARAKVAQYKRANPDRVRAWGATRRKREAGRVPGSIVKRLLALQCGKCAICRDKLPKDYHLDHIHPLARGGTNKPGNLQLLCPACNTRKGAKDPIDFMQERGFLL